MAKRNSSGFEVLAALPWPVGLVLGVLAFVGIRYGIPWYFSASSNSVLSGLGHGMRGGGFASLAWFALGICWAAALLSALSKLRRARLLDEQTSLESIRAMSWREFEMLTGEAFRRQGYRVEETGLGGADGGVDLILRKGGKRTLVQCKQWRNQRVDVKVAREMYGLLSHHAADAVKIVAVGDYTSEAREFVCGKPIELINGDALLALIGGVQKAKKVRVPVEAKLLSSTAGAPSCPKCARLMVRRYNRMTRQSFWGCSNYPICRGTRPS